MENLTIGEKPQPVEPKPVIIVSLEEKEVKTDNFTRNKLILKCRHEDVGDIDIGKIRFMKGKNLTDSGLWITKEKEGKLPYNCAISYLMRHLGVKFMEDLKDKQIETILDDNDYLIGKIY